MCCLPVQAKAPDLGVAEDCTMLSLPHDCDAMADNVPPCASGQGQKTDVAVSVLVVMRILLFQMKVLALLSLYALIIFAPYVHSGVPR